MDIRALVEEKWFPTHDGLVLVEDDQVIESHTSPSAMVRALVEHGLVDDKFEGKNFSLMYLQGKSPLSSS